MNEYETLSEQRNGPRMLVAAILLASVLWGAAVIAVLTYFCG